MSEPKTIGLRMAKASTQDLDAAFVLAGILDSLGRGYYPTGGKDQGEDAPTYFDRDDIDHLQHLHELLCGIEQRGSLFRVAGGLSTLLSDANGIVDPDDDCIALHPRIKDALAQQPAADSPSFTAADMTDAAAQGFRDGVASVGQDAAGVGVCAWHEDTDEGSWRGACGTAWSLEGDGPTDNGMRYCPNCGRQVAQQGGRSDAN